ncbi:MAG: hypothetical protein IPN70_04985 [Candidatus Moraniibacteriota bacterium]|nr:MAG: hypothetical protein IPN70_04985 [Candidatus Moranbacteria bacterium]
MKQKKILLGFILIGIFVFSLAYIWMSLSNKKEESVLKKEEAFSLRIEPKDLIIKNGKSDNIKAFLGEKEVTEEVFWSSSDDKIIFASDTAGIRGQLDARSVGEAKISGALYKDESIKTSVSVFVEPIPLEISCEPIPSAVKIGERVRWILYYKKTGVAKYEYSWTGDDGLSGKDGEVEKVYETPGTKKAKVWTKDSVGAEASAECNPVIVE